MFDIKPILKRPIVLVGLMGAGKTSVGKLLARRLGLPFIDSDREIVRAAGTSVVDIFSIYGEREFRRVEERIVRRLLSDGEVRIVSTGEGAYIIDSVRKLARDRAVTVWLRADLDLLVKRTSFKDTRPLLLNHSPGEILQRLIDERYPIYAKADITVETRNEPTFKTADNVLAALAGFLRKGRK
ncbi:MAG: shikimate kinase [Rickettsiales bacterium]|jgi:shikimate kinase|nr:shikimate kinase [Rickettsiales bacterium]